MRAITRYPSVDNSEIYGTLGIPGVDEVHVIYEGPWTSEEMDQVEARIIIPYMWKQSRCYLRAEKQENFPSQGKSWFYAQYYNWQFSITGLDFEEWLQKLEVYHQQYSKIQIDE